MRWRLLLIVAVILAFAVGVASAGAVPKCGRGNRPPCPPSSTTTTSSTTT